MTEQELLTKKIEYEGYITDLNSSIAAKPLRVYLQVQLKLQQYYLDEINKELEQYE